MPDFRFPFYEEEMNANKATIKTLQGTSEELLLAALVTKLAVPSPDAKFDFAFAVGIGNSHNAIIQFYEEDY